MDSAVFIDVKQSFVDYPCRLSLTAYMPGCNLTCPYCCNQAVVHGRPAVSIKQLLARVSRLERIISAEPPAVVLTGGEPTIHPRLEEIWRALRALSPRTPIGLHTNGFSLPPILREDPPNAVVLGVKLPGDVPDYSTYTTYILPAALRFYAQAPQKELRIVRTATNPMDANDINELLNNVFGWRVVVVDDVLAKTHEPLEV